MGPKSFRLVLALSVAAAWLGGCGPSRQSLAQREILAAGRLANAPTDGHLGMGGDLYWHVELDKPIRQKILEHARRAAKLDPANEEAYYLLAIHADAALPPDGQRNPVGCAVLAIPACQTYLDRFGGQAPDHHRNVLNRQFLTAWIAFANLHQWTRKDDILRQPDARAFPYASAYVKALAQWGFFGELDQRYNNSDAWEGFSYCLVRHVIPNCPADKLDEEYAYWERFWREHRQQIEYTREMVVSPRSLCPTRPLPWGVIAAAFAARRGDAQAVRRAFAQAALEVPQTNGHVWGDPHAPSPFEHLVPLYLKAARDPEWQTWMPDFPPPAARAVTPAPAPTAG